MALFPQNKNISARIRRTLVKEDLAKASKLVGLTDLQADSLWQALQKMQMDKPKTGFLTALLYVGAMIAFVSMSWFYSVHLEDRVSLGISGVYALIFFATGSYLWRVKHLKTSGGVLVSLGIIMVPLIVYSLQSVMHWLPASCSGDYSFFDQGINGDWIPMEACTLAVACLVLYFIRFPFITALIYCALTFLFLDAVYLFVDPKADHRFYYCVVFVTMGIALNILGSVLCRKEQKDFGFWSFLFGMALCWTGLTGWDIRTEWGHFMYFLTQLAWVFLANFFHRKIFLFFGSLGIIWYIGHLAYVFSDSLMFSYVLGAIGFAIIMVATFFLRLRKKKQVG